MTPTIGQMIEQFVKLRDFMKARAEKRTEEDKPYIEAMSTLENAVLAHLNAENEQSVKTEWGTAYKSTTMSARVADSTAFFDYVREADAFHLLIAGAAKDAVKVHMDEHQGMPPPGVDVSYFTKVNFRRA